MAVRIRRTYAPEELLDYRRRVDAYKFEADAARVEATRKLVDFRFLRGDLHTHSLYSDGKGSVAENWTVARQRGLDFLFVTDHGTVRQKALCRNVPGLWWGQEPGAQFQHIAILGIDRKFEPSKSLERDAQRLREMGAFFFFPHPAGWYPRTWYPPERIEILDRVGEAFAIEIKNGIFRTEPFYDDWEKAFVEVWDRLLCSGRRVIGLAASDAHMPASVGNVWTGVLGCRHQMGSVLKALRSGRVFASSGPVINLESDTAPMGGEARPRNGRLKIRFECADSYGLNWTRVVQDGREVRRFAFRGAPHAAAEICLRLGRSARYVRVECAANDDRRGYSNPIYIVR